MYPVRYFCNRLFAPRYFPKHGAASTGRRFWKLRTGVTPFSNSGTKRLTFTKT